MGESPLRSNKFPVSAPERRRENGPRPLGGSRRIDGFTLVELLVVIAIIAILASLLLPGLRSVRESGRRVQCKTNIRNVAQAIRGYAEATGTMPPAGIVDPERVVDHFVIDDFEPRTGNQFSWIVLILPRLEEQALYDQFNFESSVFAQQSNPQAQPLSVLRCPSDGKEVLYFEAANSDPASSDGGVVKRFAKGNYAAYVSPFHVDLCEYFPGALTGYAQSTAAIRDGESKTLMLSEVLARNHPQDQRGAWALPWTGSSLLAFDLHYPHPLRYMAIPVGSSNYYWEKPRPVYKAWGASVGQNQKPNNQGPVFDMLYACPDPEQAQIDGMPCSVWQKGTGFEYLSAAPRSQHQGGVNVAFADGRVDFLADTVDEVTMAYMISIDDGYVGPRDQ